MVLDFGPTKLFRPKPKMNLYHFTTCYIQHNINIKRYVIAQSVSTVEKRQYKTACKQFIETSVILGKSLNVHKLKKKTVRLKLYR